MTGLTLERAYLNSDSGAALFQTFAPSGTFPQATSGLTAGSQRGTRGRELEVKLGRREGGVCHETGERARVCVCVGEKTWRREAKRPWQQKGSGQMRRR